MALNSINRLRGLRLVLTGLRRRWLQWRTGVMIDPSCSISLSSRFLPGQPGGITVGADTLVAFKTLIDARDLASGTVRPIRIGERCFVGGGSMILPGVTIADEVIIAAGAVVTHDVPARCIVAGNPARVIRRDIEVGRFGRLASADANIAKFLEQRAKGG
jgi:maltose O-acetyltransferase